ncbi:GNAT family N-acetyltransferase [Proteiniborus sp. MB09-C3]|uniref:GNAT family N-acetyltransferase n=1 Tax=Proteiniborus sp. MB09-C3 TaxID=3050072 RepID=UPI0025528715|nr:GNAT family N-acetyltransferase [Proteiniborus sp. MB09-C3]WIV13382.1 GNAT family N-acetyltransferase [Proteiniborus sp. MB09-C3]
MLNHQKNCTLLNNCSIRKENNNGIKNIEQNSSFKLKYGKSSIIAESGLGKSILLNMIIENKTQGRLIYADQKIVGFIIWMIDEERNDYSVIPGYGTILEIGLAKDYRNKGIGKNIVQYAEEQMLEKGADSFYVTVYNPAKIFWENCGYVNTEKIAFNGLQIYKKAKGIIMDNN